MLDLIGPAWLRLAFRKRMTRTIRIALVGAATVLSGVAVYYWALRLLGFASYLSSTAASDADIIRQ